MKNKIAKGTAAAFLLVLCLGLAGRGQAGGDVLEAPAPAEATWREAATAVTPLNDRDYAPGVLRLLENARHSIRLSLYQVRYYPDHPGSDSNRLVEAVADAARRGLEVTVILDISPWRPSHDEENKLVATMLAEAGATVYLDPPDVQSHQKLVIVDRDVVVLGSANWSHYSLSHNNEAGVILWCRGAGRHYNEYFAARLVEARPWVPEGTVPAPLAEAFGPEDLGLPSYTAEEIRHVDNQLYFHRVRDAIRNASESVELIQNYAYHYGRIHPRSDQVEGRPAGKLPETDLLLEELVAARERGVAVRAIFDHQDTPDFRKPWDRRTRAFAGRLAAAGADVYKDDPVVQIHAKALVIDNRKVLVSSTNWSFEGIALNNETGVLITAPELVEDVYRAWADGIFEGGKPFTPDN